MQFLTDILQLPHRSLVNKKLTKAFFKRNFDLTLSEKKLVEDPALIVQMDWMASLKPELVNVNAYIDELQTFEEVQVIAIHVNEEKLNRQSSKLAELVQKLIPYHLLLCIYNEVEFVLHAALKSINQNHSSKRVVNTWHFTDAISLAASSSTQKAFVAALAFNQLNKDNLKVLYESYIAAITALNTSALTGVYALRPNERSKQDAECVMAIQTLQSEIATLQNQAKKESQLNMQLKLNEEVQHLRKEIETLKQKLQA